MYRDEEGTTFPAANIGGLIVVILLAITIVEGIIYWPMPQARPTEAPVVSPEAGRLLRIAGDLQVAIVQGESPYQIGFVHGQLFSADIAELVAALRKELFHPNILRAQLDRMKVYYQVRRLARALPAECRSELTGIADGAGVAYRDILLLNLWPDIAAGENSTHLAVWGAACTTHQLLHAANIGHSFPSLVRGKDVLFILNFEDRQDCVFLGWPGQAGTPFGFNEAGLAVSSCIVPVKQNVPGTPTHLWSRRVLSSSQSVQQGISRIVSAAKSEGNIAGGMWLLSTVAGTSLVEAAAGKVSVVSGDTGWLVTANHFQTLDSDTTQDIRFSLQRSTRAGRLMQQLSPISLRKVLTILRDQSGSTPEPERQIANARNVATIICSPVDKTLWILRSAIPPAKSETATKVVFSHDGEAFDIVKATEVERVEESMDEDQTTSPGSSLK